MNDDIANALKQADALNLFIALPPSHQKEYLEWIMSAKKPETKAKRIQKMIEMMRAKQ